MSETMVGWIGVVSLVASCGVLALARRWLAKDIALLDEATETYQRVLTMLEDSELREPPPPSS